MQSRLSILGLYNYRPDIFDDMAVPAGLVKSRMIDTILMECADIGLTYPQPDTMKRMIKTWSYNKLPAWSRILAALEEEYDPLHNYDRHESWTDSGSHDNASSGSHSNTTSGSHNTSTSAEAQASGTNLEKIAGFNDGNALANKGQNDQNTSSESSGTESGSTSGTDTGTASGTDTGSYENVKTGHTYGNIGVTTSAQMLQGEIDVRTANDMYNIILQSFKNQFCIQIY